MVDEADVSHVRQVPGGKTGPLYIAVLREAQNKKRRLRQHLPLINCVICIVFSSRPLGVLNCVLDLKAVFCVVVP